MALSFAGDEDYIFDDESDDSKKTDSSEDEIDSFLNNLSDRGGTREVRKEVPVKQKEESSSEDEFEKEMNAELSATVSALEQQHGITGSVEAGPSVKTQKFYDNIYFDSDSDEEGHREEKKGRKRPVISNDDLLYDPKMDDDDQRWVDARRRRYQPHSNNLKSDSKHAQSGKHAKVQPLPSSDAVLNCPGCMTTLCLDCQRHDIYDNQYRAMFVEHCKVNTSEELSFPKSAKSRKKQRRNKQTAPETNGSDNSSDKYHPVHCDECNTEVGVYDQDEIYHFFNVLSSYS